MRAGRVGAGEQEPPLRGFRLIGRVSSSGDVLDLVREDARLGGSGRSRKPRSFGHRIGRSRVGGSNPCLAARTFELVHSFLPDGPLVSIVAQSVKVFLPRVGDSPPKSYIWVLGRCAMPKRREVETPLTPLSEKRKRADLPPDKKSAKKGSDTAPVPRDKPTVPTKVTTDAGIAPETRARGTSTRLSESDSKAYAESNHRVGEEGLLALKPSGHSNIVAVYQTTGDHDSAITTLTNEKMMWRSKYIELVVAQFGEPSTTSAGPTTYRDAEPRMRPCCEMGRNKKSKSRAGRRAARSAGLPAGERTASKVTPQKRKAADSAVEPAVCCRACCLLSSLLSAVEPAVVRLGEMLAEEEALAPESSVGPDNGGTRNWFEDETLSVSTFAADVPMVAPGRTKRPLIDLLTARTLGGDGLAVSQCQPASSRGSSWRRSTVPSVLPSFLIVLRMRTASSGRNVIPGVAFRLQATASRPSFQSRLGCFDGLAYVSQEFELSDSKPEKRAKKPWTYRTMSARATAARGDIASGRQSRRILCANRRTKTLHRSSDHLLVSSVIGSGGSIRGHSIFGIENVFQGKDRSFDNMIVMTFFLEANLRTEQVARVFSAYGLTDFAKVAKSLQSKWKLDAVEWFDEVIDQCKNDSLKAVLIEWTQFTFEAPLDTDYGTDDEKDHAETETNDKNDEDSELDDHLHIHYAGGQKEGRGRETGRHEEAAGIAAMSGATPGDTGFVAWQIVKRNALAAIRQVVAENLLGEEAVADLAEVSVRDV
ncbi:hypothetical protein VTK73DRAFT_8569 [Phialemonium thermophilum]|uniref:Uncharacterized protein n=1 Tax=Phialemonium thermophilum TaxID=223376 RepID=A0ABR3W7N9_9PEZI